MAGALQLVPPPADPRPGYWGTKRSAEENRDGGGGPEAVAACREDLEELLAEDEAAWGRFARAAEQGAHALRSELPAFREALKARGRWYAWEDAHGALFAVAEELLPDDPASVRPRLRERTAAAVSPRPGGGVRLRPGAPVRDAVTVALAYESWVFDEAALAAGLGHDELYLVAGHVQRALKGIGHEHPVEAVEDELWTLIREMAPGSPAARQDVARVEALMARAQAYVEEHDPDGALGEEERAEHEVRALSAIKRHDLAGLRAALRELCRAARDAALRASANDGPAA